MLASQHLNDKEFNAHSDPRRDGVTNTGYWQTDQSYHDEKDPIKRAARMVDETLRPQQAMSKAAFNSAINQEAIQIAADDLGITTEELLSVEVNKRGKTMANVYRDELKKSGFDSKGMEKVLVWGEVEPVQGLPVIRQVLDDRPGISDNRRPYGYERQYGLGTRS